MQLKSSLISFNHHFDSPVIPTELKKLITTRFEASFVFHRHSTIIRHNFFIRHFRVVPKRIRCSMVVALL